MSKVERLLNLMLLLRNSSRPVTIAEIGATVPGYPEGGANLSKAVERDKADLRDMGIEILVETPDGDNTQTGYRIEPGARIPDPELDPVELAALSLAAAAVRLEGESDENVVQKLGAVGTEAVGRSALAELPDHEHLAPLFDAINARRLVSFEYRDVARSLEPHRLDFNRGRWYVSGFDRVRQDRRTFRVADIVGPLEFGPPDAFEAPDDRPGVVMEPWRYGDAPPLVGTIRIDASHAAVAAAELGEDVTTRIEADGSLIAELVVSDRAAFRSLVLSFLDHAEVVAPDELRDDIVQWLRALVG